MKTQNSHTLIIQASRGLPSLGLRELWEYRDLLSIMVWRDLKARYRQTALGWLWIVLQPLLSMLLYTFIFGAVARLPSDNRPYAVFTYAALLPWTFFAGALTSGTNSLLDSMGLLSKVYYPRLIPPLAQIISSLVDFAISFVILLIMTAIYGIQPVWGALLLVPVFMLIAAVTGLGVGLWFAGVIVKYRDVGHIVGYLTRVGMYASPVVYASSLVPERFRALYHLNPMAGVIEGFRWAVLNTGQPPDALPMIASAIMAALVFVGGVYYLRWVERTIVDAA